MLQLKDSIWMYKKNKTHIYAVWNISHKKEWNLAIYDNMDGLRG